MTMPVTAVTNTTTVNGVTVTTPDTVTVVWKDVAVQVAGPCTLTNRTTGPRLVSVQSVPGATVLGPTAVTWEKSTAVVIAPGQSFQVGAPPSGQVWLIAVVSPAQESRLAWIGTLALAGMVGLAAYGGFELVARVVKEVRYRMARDDRDAQRRTARR